MCASVSTALVIHPMSLYAREIIQFVRKELRIPYSILPDEIIKIRCHDIWMRWHAQSFKEKDNETEADQVR